MWSSIFSGSCLRAGALAGRGGSGLGGQWKACFRVVIAGGAVSVANVDCFGFLGALFRAGKLSCAAALRIGCIYITLKK